MFFKVKAGKHAGRNADGEHIIYGKGDVVESDKDLCMRFRNKFERLDDNIVLPIEQPEIPEPDPPVTDVNVESRADALGENITDDIVDAEDLGIMIYKRLGWYSVVDVETSAPLVDKKMRRDEVLQFVADLRAKEPEEPKEPEESEK